MGTIRFTRSPDVVYDIADGRALLLDGDGTHLVTLNPLGTEIWQQLDSGASVGELADTLEPRFADVGRDRLLADCEAFITGLLAHGLIDAVD